MAANIFSFNKKPKAEPEEALPELVEDPIGKQPYHDPLAVEHARKVEEGEGPWLISYADLMTLLMGFFALVASFSKPDVKSLEEVKKSAAEKFGGAYQEPYIDLEVQVRKAIREAQADQQVQVTRGVDGVTIKFNGVALFTSGQFEVKPEGAEIIHRIVRSMNGQISGYKVTIEGHTDNVPINHEIIGSNWELSAIRAARVAKIFETDGFSKQQLIIQGWGETRPEVPNVQANGEPIPLNQARNRRVLIRIAR